MAEWTTVADLQTKIRRRWTDGSLLHAYASGEAAPSFSCPVRGPRAGEIGGRLEEVRRWREVIRRGSAGGAAFDLVEEAIGGRVGGRNQIPKRALVQTYDQAWRLLGVQAEVSAFEAMLEQIRVAAPELLDWVVAHPMRLLKVRESWPQTLAAYRWLRSPTARGAWLRQISAPGVDTKFVEQHHALLAELLLASGMEALPVDGSPGSVGAFAQRFGLRSPERLVHVRFDREFAGMPSALSEGSFRLAELAQIRVGVGIVVIVENLQSFQAWPVPPEGVLIWGAGYLAPRLSRLPWVREARRVVYSGDLDTHGFAILSGLRSTIPKVESLAMDRRTLLAHRDHWGSEPSPTSARLPHLTPDESELYRDLVEDTNGSKVRLEQERLDWSHVEELIAEAGIGSLD